MENLKHIFRNGSATAFSIAAVAIAALAAVSCIENDMTYPRTRANITVFDVEGQVTSVVDANKRTVSITLEETAEISALVVDSTAVSDGSVCLNLPAKGDIIDLTDPNKYTLSLYYDFEWTVSATQEINRYVNCENQAGAAYFNLTTKDVTVYVSDIQELNDITFTSMKLEPTGSVISSTTGYVERDGQMVMETVAVGFPITLDCTMQRTFEVQYKDETITWTMSVVQKELSMEVDAINAWTYHADIEGTFNGSGDPYFAYRQAGSSSWIDFKDVVIDGVTVSATIPGSNTIDPSSLRLSPGTQYEVKMVNGDKESDAVSFTTETPDQLANMDFEDWYYDGKVWYPCAEDDFGIKVWDSANKGVGTFLSYNPTQPEESFTATPSSKKAVQLTTTYALVKYAAGNIYTGEFLRVENLGAVLTWGVPFTKRPRAIRGYYSYSPGILNYIENKKVSNSDELDRCQLLCMLTDWDEPFEVNSSANQFVDHDNDEHIIAYFRMESDVDTGGEYVYFEYELDYRRPFAIPKYAVVVCCASQGGDVFTGSTDSVMYVDELEFVYD